MAVELIGEYNDIKLYRLISGKSYVEIMNYGARIHKICVPDKNGNLKDVVLGFEHPVEYKGDNPYFNAVIGRVANRIGGAKFTLDGKEYTLTANENGNQLHGGLQGFDRKLFDSTIVDDKLVLTCRSKDGEEGYPCNLSATVEYTFSDGSLRISYKATTDGKTHCSLTNHAYFNLNGDYQSIDNHLLTIKASALTDIDRDLIPNGNIIDVNGSVYDFREPKTIGRDISANDRLLNIAGGYDFNYVLDSNEQPVAVVVGDKSGIEMRVYTDRPCIQFYSGNFLDGSIKGKAVFGKRSAFALETQGYPNACNVPTFPSTVIDESHPFESVTTYSFGLVDEK